MLNANTYLRIIFYKSTQQGILYNNNKNNKNSRCRCTCVKLVVAGSLPTHTTINAKHRDIFIC